jgi:hypothetical protein
LEADSAYGPKEPVWTYTAENPSSFYAIGQSGAQRLANGNTMICNGPKGFFFEVTPEKKTVWTYINPLPNPLLIGKNNVFKINSYPKDYPGVKALSVKKEKLDYNIFNSYMMLRFLEQFPLLEELLEKWR